jgi:DNA-binding transcriptional MerR regulator
MDREDGGNAKDGAERWLTTGEMARLSQTTLRTVRFYEAEGLIASRARGDGSHRKFPSSELEKLQIIADLREAGLSLQDIKELMALKGGYGTAEQAACKMSVALSAQIAELERRAATLQRVRGELMSMVGVLRVCQGCTHPDFPARCRDCTLVSAPAAARATQLLWKN